MFKMKTVGGFFFPYAGFFFLAAAVSDLVDSGDALAFARVMISSLDLDQIMYQPRCNSLPALLWCGPEPQRPLIRVFDYEPPSYYRWIS